MDKIRFSDYEGREQAFIKHTLLQSYLPEWGYKVGRQWDYVLFIDTHAGPWNGNDEDLSDTSFSIGVEAVRKMALGLRGRHDNPIGAKAFLNEPNNSPKDGYPFQRLSRYASEKSGKDIEIIPNNQKFEDATEKIKSFIAKHPRSFRFILIDPKGWKSIPMKSISEITNNRSSEVLINLMTQDLRRFLQESDRAESYKRLFGRDEALESVMKHPKGEREDALVREYCISLKQCCGFQYVSSCAVLSPERNDTKYFLVFATNHHRGIEVFKDAEKKANSLQESIKLEKQELKANQKAGCDSLFSLVDLSISTYLQKLRKRYRSKAREKLLEILTKESKILYKEAFCVTMAFPLFNKEDLATLISSEDSIELVLDVTTGLKRKAPSCDKKDYLILKQP